MALADIVEGLRAAVEVTLAVESDISEAGGATH
jgi:hypothetical protein